MTDLNSLKESLVEHKRSDDARYDRMTKWMAEQAKDIRTIKDNHLAHLGNDVSQLKTDMEWVKKIQWALVTGIISNLIGILYLIIEK